MIILSNQDGSKIAEHLSSLRAHYDNHWQWGIASTQEGTERLRQKQADLLNELEELANLCQPTEPTLSPAGSPKKRQMFVESAQIWYEAAKDPTPDCDVVTGLSNALNHTENVLVAVVEGNSELLEKLKLRLAKLRAR